MATSRRPSADAGRSTRPDASDASDAEVPARTAAERVAAVLPSEDRSAFRAAWHAARAAVVIGEADDLLFARAQALVRRALLGLGRLWRRRGALDRDDDVFFLPFDDVRAAALDGSTPIHARERARAGREACASARRRPPPAPGDDPRRAPLAGAVRGHGTGGRALGRVRRHGAPTAMSGHDVLVATTLLPAELPLLEAAALVVETGGPLGHVAAQARDRGLPAVVGAAGALDLLGEGDPVLVDADLGLVVRLGC